MEKLYNIDSYIFEFKATVISCEKTDNGYKCVLSQTAFFPEQGGQKGDTGTIGNANVIDTKIENSIVYSVTDIELQPDIEYKCAVDKNERYRKMQNHTGEHILSGIAHNLYGCENTGFHLSDNITVDFDLLLSDDQIKIIEQKANEAIWENRKINILYPNNPENIQYRSKKEIVGEQIRLVEIEGIDMCACCAPHVKTTSEVGLIKILSHMKHRGGTRLFAVCGMDAYKDYVAKFKNVIEISNLLSSPANDISKSVQALYYEYNQLKKEIADKSLQIAKSKIEAFDNVSGNICIEVDELNSKSCIELVNEGKEKCDGLFVLCVKSENGLRYTIGSKNVDLKEEIQKINTALNGKGGGRGEIIQGTFTADFNKVKEYFLK